MKIGKEEKMSEHKGLRSCVKELSRRVDFNIACSRMTQGAEALYRNLVWWRFLPDEALFDRVHLIGIAGALRLTTDETNELLALADFEPLKEGEAADGTKIADLEKKVAALEEVALALRKERRSLSREEVEARYPHGLGLAP